MLLPFTFHWPKPSPWPCLISPGVGKCNSVKCPEWELLYMWSTLITVQVPVSLPSQMLARWLCILHDSFTIQNLVESSHQLRLGQVQGFIMETHKGGYMLVSQRLQTGQNSSLSFFFGENLCCSSTKPASPKVMRYGRDSQIQAKLWALPGDSVRYLKRVFLKNKWIEKVCLIYSML